ncbi:meiotic recombination protein REC8 homolog [Ylistrum balloti]|uniref:meiotic recombination protein REC8 homolog n=1 Tax=Ylistrum balloti TaxID=509963 RepID=UPI002905E204|nr:meiotic recombination protein REC8 homolog [Ylistrum balloti]
MEYEVLKEQRMKDRMKSIRKLNMLLAATRIEHLKRRELSEVNLQTTCDDIIDHIMVRLHATTPGKKKTRFSLYLSSQLMYGVTRVLKRQSEFLFSDVSTFFNRVRMAFVTDVEGEIDLKGILRCEMVTIPDLANFDSPGRPGFDPAFGSMRMKSSETKITYPELEMWKVNSSIIPGSPYLSPVPKKRGSSSVSKDDSHMIQPEVGSPHTVSSREEITIQEEEIKIPDIEVPGEKDLPTFDGKELDMILEAPPDPNINWMDVLSPLVPEPPKDASVEQMAQDQYVPCVYNKILTAIYMHRSMAQNPNPIFY